MEEIRSIAVKTYGGRRSSKRKRPTILQLDVGGRPAWLLDHIAATLGLEDRAAVYRLLRTSSWPKKDAGLVHGKDFVDLAGGELQALRNAWNELDQSEGGLAAKHSLPKHAHVVILVFRGAVDALCDRVLGSLDASRFPAATKLAVHVAGKPVKAKEEPKKKKKVKPVVKAADEKLEAALARIVVLEAANEKLRKRNKRSVIEAVVEDFADEMGAKHIEANPSVYPAVETKVTVGKGRKGGWPDLIRNNARLFVLEMFKVDDRRIYSTLKNVPVKHLLTVTEALRDWLIQLKQHADKGLEAMPEPKALKLVKTAMTAAGRDKLDETKAKP